MSIQLRFVPHTNDELAMSHCYWWPLIDVDAISCTHNPNGFSPMLAVIRSLGRDMGYFTHTKLTAMHSGKFLVISHAYEVRPVVITSSRTAEWDTESHAAAEIIQVADVERSRSLCMTHFSFLPGRFPTRAFEQCVRSAKLASHHTSITRITIDVDARCQVQAERVLDDVRRARAT
jgi:hypothetical protein